MVTIVDYGSGNLRSVQKAFERLGATTCITDDPHVVAEAKRLVLPGVGAFGDAMRSLHSRGLVEPIRAHLLADRPFFGICMGLQLLFETGWEGGCHQGLGILAGDVSRFDLAEGMKIPHMGWNTVAWREGSSRRTLLGNSHYFYFVHSYYPQPKDDAVVAASTDYGGSFCSAVARGRLFATQFHPEKSQAAGMLLLQSFLDETR
ncbi:MAG: imidazole glycerol phosphate synthase subunit HisH [Planctomycetaceae bacterium]|nr:MAG: imidazole glycerol phosphate synthase subunit HisH [Planctomycetaceae bacterium]